MGKSDCSERLLHLIKKAVSPFHTVEACREELTGHGFLELDAKEEWELKRGGKYFLVWHGSSLFAFTVGHHAVPGDAFRIAAAHGDFPGFRIKPNPEIQADGYLELNVEAYGGAVLASWLDRPLSAAGRIAVRSDDIFHPGIRLLDVKSPFLTIPNIAPHIERDLNKGMELNKQTHMLPVIGLLDGKDCGKGIFHAFLAEHAGISPEDVLDYELTVYNAEAGDSIGMGGEFISSPRLDNLTGVQAVLEGIEAGVRGDGVNLMAVFDHEEIGSRTKQGAGSNLMPLLVKRIYEGLGFPQDGAARALSDSLLMSVDVAHGLHPNFTKKYDPTNKCVLNGGICLKEACSQAYATDSEAAAIVQQICGYAGILYQKSVNRSDGSGGSTLGAIASAMLPVRTADIGVPLLAMHSSRELMGAKDQEAMVRFMEVYYTV